MRETFFPQTKVLHEFFFGSLSFAVVLPWLGLVERSKELFVSLRSTHLRPFLVTGHLSPPHSARPCLSAQASALGIAMGGKTVDFSSPPFSPKGREEKNKVNSLTSNGAFFCFLFLYAAHISIPTHFLCDVPELKNFFRAVCSSFRSRVLFFIFLPFIVTTFLAYLLRIWSPSWLREGSSFCWKVRLRFASVARTRARGEGLKCGVCMQH